MLLWEGWRAPSAPPGLVSYPAAPSRVGGVAGYETTPGHRSHERDYAAVYAHAHFRVLEVPGRRTCPDKGRPDKGSLSVYSIHQYVKSEMLRVKELLIGVGQGMKHTFQRERVTSCKIDTCATVSNSQEE